MPREARPQKKATPRRPENLLALAGTCVIILQFGRCSQLGRRGRNLPLSRAVEETRVVEMQTRFSASAENCPECLTKHAGAGRQGCGLQGRRRRPGLALDTIESGVHSPPKTQAGGPIRRTTPRYRVISRPHWGNGGVQSAAACACDRWHGRDPFPPAARRTRRSLRLVLLATRKPSAAPCRRRSFAEPGQRTTGSLGLMAMSRGGSQPARRPGTSTRHDLFAPHPCGVRCPHRCPNASIFRRPCPIEVKTVVHLQHPAGSAPHGWSCFHTTN
jgi:hypothetical protein